MKLYYTYVLKSNVDGRLYKGHTDDVEKRLREHNAGKTKSTKGFIPWELVYFEIFKSKIGRASCRERVYIESVRVLVKDIRNTKVNCFREDLLPRSSNGYMPSGMQAISELKAMKFYYTYVLKSNVDGRLYKGHTDDVEKRLREHNAGKTKSTKGFIPWELVYFEIFKS